MAQEITVEGMTCGHCEGSVEDAVENVTGVSAATADRETDSVSVEGSADPEELIAAVEDAGYDASV
jgi:copper chaperone CopZ